MNPHATAAAAPTDISTTVPTTVPTATPTVGPHCYVVVLRGPDIPQGPPQATVAFYGPENDYLCLQMVGITNGGLSAAQVAGSNYKSIACARGGGDNIVRVWSDDPTWGKAVCLVYDRDYAGLLTQRLTSLIFRRASAPRP